jgi:hypothetical protein
MPIILEKLLLNLAVWFLEKKLGKLADSHKERLQSLLNASPLTPDSNPPLSKVNNPNSKDML